MSQTKIALKANASLLDVVMLGAGAAIGSSIFSVLSPAAGVAGDAMLWAILAAVIPMATLAIVYSAVAAVAPRSGASFEWPRLFVSPKLAFFVAWMRILGSVGQLVIGSLVLAKYLSVIIAVPTTPIMFGIFVVLYLLNVLGISHAAKAQTTMMILLIVAFAIFTAFGAPHVRVENLQPLASGFDLVTVVLTMPLLIHLFMGIETASEIGEEVHNGRRNVPLGIAISVALTLVIYLIVTTTTLGIIGVGETAANDTPLTEAATLANKGIALPVILGAAVLCLVKSLNVNFMIFTRNIFVMGRSGILPGVLGKVHARRGTPHMAATAVFGLACCGLLLPQNLVFLFVATSIPTLLKYLSTCLSALNMRRKRPDLVADAKSIIPPKALSIAAIAGILMIVTIVVSGAELDWRAYALLAGWTALGGGYFLIKRPVISTD